MTKLWNELTPKQRVNRWSHAVRVIENMSDHEIENHFDMSEWAYKNACGTIGCAAGQCGMDPKIRKQGFKLNWFKDVTAGYMYRSRFTIPPYDFYGEYAYRQIFTGENFVRLEGKVAHTLVLQAMKDYLRVLKTDAV